jgi:hypothetical protein
MVTDLATRFAETSIRLYGHERTFDIGLDHGLDFETVAQAFEKMGCQVQRNLPRRSLTVTCPERSH